MLTFPFSGEYFKNIPFSTSYHHHKTYFFYQTYTKNEDCICSLNYSVLVVKLNNDEEILKTFENWQKLANIAWIYHLLGSCTLPERWKITKISDHKMSGFLNLLSFWHVETISPKQYSKPMSSSQRCHN